MNNQPQYNQQQYNHPQYNHPQYNQPQYNHPQHNQPQYNQQQNQLKHYIFFQPGCQDSEEFFKLLQFSQTLNRQFQRINVTVPGQKVPPNVQCTPSIAIYPNYKIQNPDESFKWLQQAIIHEQRNNSSMNQQPQQQHQHQQHQQQQTGSGFPAPQRIERPGSTNRVNMPVYNPDINGGGNTQKSTTQSNPSGKEPSQNFNTYDPTRDQVRPFMSDMDSHGSGNFAYLGTELAPPLNYAHIPNQSHQEGQPGQGHVGPNGQPIFTASKPGRPQKLPETQYQNYIQSRSQDPYIQQQMSQSY
jgi:hypothetical protein